VVDYEADYEVDYLDWEVFCGIKAVGGVLFPQRQINIVTDHKNLEYFSTTKILTQHQACWSKYPPVRCNER